MMGANCKINIMMKKNYIAPYSSAYKLMRLCRNEVPQKVEELLTIRFKKEFGIAPDSFHLTGP